MNPSRLRIAGLALIVLAGCSHMNRAPEPAPTAPEAPLAALKLPHFCLGRAMHPEMLLSADASPEELQKVHWTGYFESYLDAREQQKYVDCLDEDRTAKDYEKDRREATKWLEYARAEKTKYEAFFPADKRIADAVESFSDVSDKIGVRRVEITLKDGTKKVEENRFDKSPQ